MKTAAMIAGDACSGEDASDVSAYRKEDDESGIAPAGRRRMRTARPTRGRGRPQLLYLAVATTAAVATCTFAAMAA